MNVDKDEYGWIRLMWMKKIIMNEEDKNEGRKLIWDYIYI